MNQSGIYKISNAIDDRFYIGSAIDLKKRWAEHISTLRNGTHRNRHLQRFVDKYGDDNLEFEIVELCNEDVILAREQYYIDLMNPSFNLSPTAGSNKGIVFSKEVRKRMSLSKIGLKRKRLIPMSNEEKIKRSLAAKKAMTPERLERLRGLRKGRVNSEEHKAKLKAGYEKMMQEKRG